MRNSTRLLHNIPSIEKNRFKDSTPSCTGQNWLIMASGTGVFLADNSVEQECRVGLKISGRKYRNLGVLPIPEK